MIQRVTKVKKKTLSGFTEAIPIGTQAENITLSNGTILQDVITELQTGRAGHADLTYEQYDALPTVEKNNGTVYFVHGSTESSQPSITAAAVSFSNNSMGNQINNVQDAINNLYERNENKLGPFDVVDSLTELSTTRPLSACQGKILQDQITKYIPLWVDFGTVSSLPVTKSSNRITSDMICTMSEVGTPSALTSDLTVTTSDGGVTVSGSITQSTTLKILLEAVNTIS